MAELIRGRGRGWWLLEWVEASPVLGWLCVLVGGEAEV